jgi:hypothetical protein
MRLKLLTLLFFSASAAFAQRAELGATGGGGATGDYGHNSAGGQVGVEGCVFCAGRFGLFGEYTHWFTGKGDVYGFRSSVDLAGFGLRLQSKGRISPFFEAGLFGGKDRHGSLGGVVLGTGVRLAVGSRWYVRPQLRFYGSYHAAAMGSVGIGYRF